MTHKNDDQYGSLTAGAVTTNAANQNAIGSAPIVVREAVEAERMAAIETDRIQHDIRANRTC